MKINGFQRAYPDDDTFQRNQLKTRLKLAAELFISTSLLAASTTTSLTWMRSSGELTTLPLPALLFVSFLLSLTVLFSEYLDYVEVKNQQ